MYDSLLATLAGPLSLTADQVTLITSLFSPRSFAKGGVFQRPGDVTTHGGFVVRGCFRTYAVHAGGKEAIVHFSPERAWIGDIESAATRTPTAYFVDAIEPSDVLLIAHGAFERLIAEIPAIGHGYRLGLQRGRAARDQRIALALKATAEERYTDFVARQPALVERIPQHMLASYLGVTPETISRIRRRLSRPPRES